MSIHVRSLLLAGLVFALANCSSEPAQTKNNNVSETVSAKSDVTKPTIAAPVDDAAAEKAKIEAEKASELAKKAEADKLAAEKLAKAEAAKAAAKEPVKVAAAMPAPASFARCVVCHDASKGGADKLGPHLFGIMGAKAGAHAPGFAYSDQLKASGLRWDAATMDKWLENPRGLVPGNRMSFPGIKDAAKRAEIIAYLQSLK